MKADKLVFVLGIVLIVVIAIIILIMLTCRCEDTETQDQTESLPPMMKYEEILEIAQNSECSEKGKILEFYTYNDVTGTWWLSLEMKEEFKNELCNPACVVNEETKTAEINWRCTGLLP